MAKHHIEIDYDAKVEFHPYRTRRVFGTYIDLDRRSPEAEEIEALLIKKSGRSYGDNHCCYTVQSPDEAPLYVWCSDDMLRIGTRIEVDNY